jgi:hypothetical protein
MIIVFRKALGLGGTGQLAAATLDDEVTAHDPLAEHTMRDVVDRDLGALAPR